MESHLSIKRNRLISPPKISTELIPRIWRKFYIPSSISRNSRDSKERVCVRLVHFQGSQKTKQLSMIQIPILIIKKPKGRHNNNNTATASEIKHGHGGVQGTQVLPAMYVDNCVSVCMAMVHRGVCALQSSAAPGRAKTLMREREILFCLLTWQTCIGMGWGQRVAW